MITDAAPHAMTRLCATPAIWRLQACEAAVGLMVSGERREERRQSPALVLTVYAAAIFLSAALLFAVQPLFTKMVLPRLGGSPSVWSVAMVFFQAMLLAGYAYAHFLTRHVPIRWSVIVHVGLLIVASLALPLAIASGWGRPPTQGEAFWLIGLFAVSIGLPFFALSANGPLLQAWFARTEHPSAKDPYFLYAASNVGSFLALISYPFLFEPFTRLPQQTFFWSLGFYGLIVLIAGCGLILLRSGNGVSALDAPATAADEAPPTWADAARWVALAAVPSGLLIAVTAHLSTDVAAAPLLWVVPLALYLATFVIVFQTRPLLPHNWMVAAQPILVVALVGVLAYEVLDSIFITMAVNLAAFFVTALVCHGELARRRPAARHLTAFYMWMSTGGMIGGIAAGLIAPQVFSWVAEYPLLIVLALLCRPGLSLPKSRIETILWIAALVIAVAVIVPRFTLQYEFDEDYYKWIIAGVITLIGVLWIVGAVRPRVFVPPVFAALVAFVFIFVQTYGTEAGRRDNVRSFFGVLKVRESGAFRILSHGTTEHGAQRVRNPNGTPYTGRPEPLTYYHNNSPMAEAIKQMHRFKDGPIRLAVVGLGAGTLACQTQPGDTLHFYEIDPAVVRIAREKFSFISQCAPDAEIILGDARLTLGDAIEPQYDVIVVDAFSSDAIPVHLLTKEAMATFLKRLADGGIILMHVSNRHMELASVVANIANANGLVARTSSSDKGDDDDSYKFSSTVVAVARNDEDFVSLASSDDWETEEPDAKQWIWTDDYSNIIGAMLRSAR